MKTVVVTGSTRGIGRGLAESFLKRGCKVMVSGRNAGTVDAAVAELAVEHGDRVAGQACDVSKAAELQALWDAAKVRFGQVDVWINNAGMSIERGPIHEADPAELEAIVATNLGGILLSARVVLAGMLEQGSGQLWNMEGFGSGGQTQPGMTAYGSTKRAVNYINKALQKDIAGTPLQVCTLSPGIVVTDLLVGDYDTSSEQWTKAKKSFNILGDTVDTVTPWLADKVLATDKSGAKVAWLTGGKAFARFATAGFNKRDLFADMENA